MTHINHPVQTIGVVLVVVLYLAAALLLPPGVDWRGAFYPASTAVVHGQSPYQPLHAGDLTGYLNPPWLLALSVPVGALGMRAGWMVWFGLMSAAYAAALVRWHFSPWIVLITLLTPLAWITPLLGNIDGLCFLGATLPPPAGLFLVLLKPQLGAGLAIYWGVLGWRDGGWKRAVRVLLPATLALGLSLLIFGDYFARGGALLDQWWNISRFPISAPFGLAALGLAIRFREPTWAMLGGLLCSPYINVITLAALCGPLFASFAQRVAARLETRSEQAAAVTRAMKGQW